MGLFGRKPKQKYHRRTPATPEAKQKQAEDKKAWELLMKQMKEDPDLERDFVLKKLGIEPKAKNQADEKRQQLQAVLTDEAIKLISEDEDLRRQYAESMLGDVIGNKGNKRSRHDDDYMNMMGSGSSVSDEIDSLLELQAKLSELGMMKGSDNGGGFFKGLTMKDVLDGVKLLKGEEVQRSPMETLYVVQVDGKPAKVTELQYNQLMKAGRIKPLVEIDSPKEEPDEPLPEEPSSSPLDRILEYVDVVTLQEFMDGDPIKFVDVLQDGVQEEIKEYQFLWGLLSNTTYDGLLSLIAPYRSDERVTNFIDRLSTDEGKIWLETVIDSVKEKQNGQ